MENNKEGIFAPLFKVTLVSKVLAGVLFITLPFIGFFLGYQAQNDIKSITTPSVYIPIIQSPVKNVSQYEEKQQPVLIYSEKISEVEGNNRGYPVLAIYKKVGDNPAVKITTVGALAEYPSNFTLSPNKKLIAVNLETKLVVIDSATGIEIFTHTPQFTIGGKTAFSPDSTQIAFVDGNTYVQTDFVSLYTANLETSEVRKLNSQTEILYSEVTAWRPDNVLLLNLVVGKGCHTGSQSFFDTVSKEFTTLPYGTVGKWSNDSTYLPKSEKSILPTVCSKIGNMCEGVYSVTTNYTVVDPVTEKIAGSFGDSNSVTIAIAFKNDNTSVLYKTTPVPKTELQCESNFWSKVDEVPTTYYVKNLQTNIVETVPDVQKILKEWHANDIYAYVDYGENGTNLTSIKVGTKILVEPSTRSKEIIAQYYGE